MPLNKRFDMEAVFPLPLVADTLVEDIIRQEQEFGHPLPDNSFYKSLAIDLIRRYAPKAEFYHRPHLINVLPLAV